LIQTAQNGHGNALESDILKTKRKESKAKSQVKKAIKVKIAMYASIALIPLVLMLLVLAFFMSPGDPSKAIQKESNFFLAFQDAIRLYTQTNVNYSDLLAAYATDYGSFEEYTQEDLANMAKPFSVPSDEDTYKILQENYSNSYSGLVSYYDEKVTTGDKEKGTEETKTIRKFYYNSYFPIASGYGASYSDDFLDERSYGDETMHDGNDVVSDEGSPIVAVEDGTIETIGWNNAGGWRIGIRSTDGKRFWYYAHMRKLHPYYLKLSKGASVSGGQVIGYVGSTGYSDAIPVDSMPENPAAVDTNFIKHLHIGLQIKKNDGTGEYIDEWVNPYPVLTFLEGNKIAVKEETKPGATPTPGATPAPGGTPQPTPPEEKTGDYISIEKNREARVFATLDITNN